ncbi:MAG: hypothetical protein JWO35_341 [Candidatus Saccharibacteria bacterium]|nr:hypothetical protein [Candidatus Saccharibacteria bacterium]
MASGHELTPPDDTVMLATLLQSHIEEMYVDGVDESSRSMEDIEAMVPASLIGRASLALTGETDIQAATKKLLTDPELKDRVLEDLSELVKGAGAVSIALAEYRKSVKVASKGSFDIRNMEQGELYTLEYEGRFRPARLTVMRDKSGGDKDDLSVTIVERNGGLIHKRFDRLAAGVVTFLGYTSSKAYYDSKLQRGAYPAWTHKVYKNDKGNWIHGGLKVDSSFRLRQMYLGEDTKLPLFSA